MSQDTPLSHDDAVTITGMMMVVSMGQTAAVNVVRHIVHSVIITRSHCTLLWRTAQCISQDGHTHDEEHAQNHDESGLSTARRVIILVTVVVVVAVITPRSRTRCATAPQIQFVIAPVIAPVRVAFDLYIVRSGREAHRKLLVEPTATTVVAVPTIARAR